MSDIAIALHIRRDLSPAEQAEVNALFIAAFGQDDSGITWASGEWVIVARDADGALVSMVEVLERTVTVDGRPVRVGGISSVGTHPDHRRRGYSTAALRAAADFMRDTLRVPFGLLVTGEEEIPFYGRLGWQPFPDPVTFGQPGERVVASDGVNMALRLGADPWPTGPVHLCGFPW